MNTSELIAVLRQADPDGNREVWIEIKIDDRHAADIAGAVSIDEAGDVLISGGGA